MKALEELSSLSTLLPNQNLYSMKPILLSSVLFFFSFQLVKGQMSCPGCTLNLPDGLAMDTLYMGASDDGQVGVFYDADISFRVPMTTTPVAAVDTTVPPDLTIDRFTVIGVSNLPPGLSWEASQTAFVTAEETDGCVKICGTPLHAGLYNVHVGLQAQVSFISQNTSFSFPIYIAPAISMNEGFTMENSTGCGTTIVSFQNNIVSNEQEGFSYFWDFGNGNTSLLENPTDQTYNEPGEYLVHYQAIVDTVGFILTNVLVETASCNDPIGNADLFFELNGPDGEVIFTSETVEEMDPPVSFDLFLEIETGNYSLNVWDADSGLAGADDLCGTINFNQLSSGSLNNGDLTVNLNIIHPVDTIITTDTVVVYEIPAPPEITINGSTAMCEGDTLTLSSSYFDNIQWYNDTLPLVGENEPVLVVTQAGDYWVEYQDENGCSSSSATVNVSILVNPETPTLTIENNLFSITNPEILQADYSFQWYLDGEVIEGATDMEYCIDISGEYYLEIATIEGCTNSSSVLNIVYDEDFPNCVSSTNEVLASTIDFQLFPNPARQFFNLSFDLESSEKVEISVMDVLGRQVWHLNERLIYGKFEQKVEVVEWERGFYLVQINIGGQALVEKLFVN